MDDFFQTVVLTELLSLFEKQQYRGQPIYYWRFQFWDRVRGIDPEVGGCGCSICEEGFESDDSIWDSALP